MPKIRTECPLTMETYRATTVVHSPYVMKTPSGELEGFLVDLMGKIAAGLNVTFNIRLAKDGRFGSIGLDGTWDGMIGELDRGEADVAVAALISTAKRLRVVDFTRYFQLESARLLVKKHSPPERSMTSLLEPFSYEVWFCIFLAAFVISILFMLIGRFNPYEWRKVPTDKDPRGARHSFGLRDSLMFVFSSMFLQGYRETPRSLAGRTLAVSWFAAVFFIVAAYIGNVGPFLKSRVEIYVPFHDLTELSTQSSIKVGSFAHGAIYQAIDADKMNPVYRNLVGNMKNSFVRSNREGIEKVRRSGGRFVFLTESLTGRYHAMREPCDLMLYGPGMFQSGRFMAVPFNSTLRARLNTMIMSLTEDGTIHQLWGKWWGPSECSNIESDTLPKQDKTGPFSTVLTLRKMTTPLFILVGGGILSIVFMIGECVFKKVRQ